MSEAQAHHLPESPSEENLHYARQKLKSGIQFGIFLSHYTATSKGFWDEYDKTFNTISQMGQSYADKYVVDVKISKFGLVVSEIGEALEGVRKPGPDQHCPEFTQEEVEIADAIIRLMDHAGKYNLRLAEAMLAKMEYNSSRPYKHGKKA